MVSMSAVWDRTTAFLSDQIAVVAAIAVPAILLPNAVQGIVQPLTATLPLSGQLGLSLFVLALSLISLWGQLALVAVALDPTPDRRRANARALHRFGAAVGLSALLLLAVVALMVPLLAILLVYGVDPGRLSDGAALDLPSAADLWIALYLLVVVPLAIWVFARLVPLTAVVVAERRGVGAIRRAFALSRGLAWRIVGVAVLYAIVASVAALAAKTVFGSILRLAFGDSGAINPASIVTAVVLATVSTIFSAIACVFIAKLYLALCIRADAAASASA